MNNTGRQSERGQALVLIVLAVVGLMGFSALAIDGGMVYAERRRAQNAADTASFAAALAVLNSENYTTAALKQAQVNGFDNIAPTEVNVYNPPQSGPYSTRADKDAYYQVIISADVKPIFSQFVFGGTLRYTVEAVAHAKPVASVIPSEAIYAASTDQCNALWFSGSGSTSVKGAGIFSNSSQVGNKSCSSGVQAGSSGVKIEGGGIQTVGSWVSDKPEKVDVDASFGVSQNVEQRIIDPLPLPDCSLLTAKTQNGSTITPGIYSGLTVHSSSLTLQPGMYCLDGDIDINGGAIIGEGVFLYLRHGSISINGNPNVLLKSSFTSLKDGKNQEWSGMLIYMPDLNQGTIDIKGDAASTFWGTIYAPGPFSGGSKSSKCEIQGSAESFNIRTQVICNSVGITGNANVLITYVPEENYRRPPKIELMQ